MKRQAVALLVVAMAVAPVAKGDVVQFFSPDQTSTLLQSGVTSDTISSNGYVFQYGRDKLFTGGTGQVIGRPVAITWPTGVEAQAITTPPPGGSVSGATLTLTRVDGKPFDLTTFQLELLANTAGAGGAVEIMPSLNGNDAFNDPVPFDVSGYSFQKFTYNTNLAGYDKYVFSLYVDYGITALTLTGAPVPEAGTLGVLGAGVAGLMMRKRRG